MHDCDESAVAKCAQVLYCLEDDDNDSHENEETVIAVKGMTRTRAKKTRTTRF